MPQVREVRKGLYTAPIIALVGGSRTGVCLEIGQILGAALEDCARRTVDKARDLRSDARAGAQARIAALEKQLGAMIEAAPAQLLSQALEALGKSGTEVQGFVLEPFHPLLISAYDALCKRLLKLPEHKLGKLAAASVVELNASRGRLKRLAREGRAQLEQRLQRHAATVRKAGEQRRLAVREAHAATVRAETQAKARARQLGIAIFVALVGAMLAVAWLI